MDKQYLLSTFNKHFFEFCDSVKAYFSDNRDIRNSVTVLQGIKAVNPKLIIKIWKSSVADLYSAQIEAKDLDFFVNKEYSNDIKDMQDNQKILSSIDQLRTPIKEMPKEDQEKSMQFVYNLTELSKLYFQ